MSLARGPCISLTCPMLIFCHGKSLQLNSLILGTYEFANISVVNGEMDPTGASLKSS